MWYDYLSGALIVCSMVIIATAAAWGIPAEAGE
jgi:hypothetical protein